MAINYGQQVNIAGFDEIVGNSRVRAQQSPPGVGVAGNPQGTLWMQGTGAVFSNNPGATQTLTWANINGGIVVLQPSAACTVTLDTATNIVTNMNANTAGINVGDIFQFLLINGSTANAITIAAGSGGSLDTNQPTPTIALNASKVLTIRVTNVTTPAYVVYV